MVDDWVLPGHSSVKARVRQHAEEIRYAWLTDGVSRRAPVSVEIHPTNACNLRCVFCSYGHVRANEMLDAEAFVALIADLGACAPPLQSVVFSGGGEPSLHPQLSRAIHALCDAGIEVGIITNGVRIPLQLHDAYLRCAWVRVSLNTPRPDRYGVVMSPHSSCNFERVLANTTRLTEARRKCGQRFPIVGLGYIIDRFCESDELLLRCLELCAHVGADYVMYRPLVDHPDLQITRSLDDLARLEPMIAEHGSELGVVHQYHKFIREFPKTVAQKPNASDHHCPIVADGLTAFVAATGDVMPCYALYMDGTRADLRYGTILEQRFRDIWDGPLRETVVRSIDARTCPFCRFQGHNAVLWNLADEDRRGATAASLPSTCNADAAINHRDPHWKFL